jgi:glycosyltransferase involved in cell wall biosynthesis
VTFRIFVPGSSALLTDHLPHGEGLICWNLLSRLAARGHDVVAVTRRSEIRAPVPFEVRTVTPVAGLGATGYAIAAAREFHRLGGRERFDLAHWLRPGGNAIAWMPRTVPGVIGPIVPSWPNAHPSETCTVAGTAAHIQESILRHRHRLVRRRCLVLLASPLASSMATGSRDVRLLPLGVDTESITPRPMPPVFTVGFIGNLEPRKGVMEVAVAFERLLRDLPTARALIAGSGSMEGELRRRLIRTGRVDFAGPYCPDQLGGLLGRMSVVALPSRGEPFGMTVLEAMAAGRPVIVADAGSPPFLVGDTGGRVIPVGDIEALSGALRNFSDLDPAQLTQAGGDARARAEAFSFDAMVLRLEAIYESVVAAGGTGRIA